MKFNLLIALFFSLGFYSKAQNVKRMGMEGSYGFIIPHFPDLSQISQSKSF
jgi:hypothetical protein